METPPWDLPVLVAYRLNGEPISLLRGGPVRIIVPWAHGFKSIKWLHRITLTNDHKANDTYADGNNEVESYLKTAAYFDDNPSSFKAGQPVTLRGTALVGWSGLKRVEYWLRAETGNHGQLPPDDPAWQTARWQPCILEPPPSDWTAHLPVGVAPREVWGFDPTTGQAREWPLRFNYAPWSLTLTGLAAGAYELRVRTIDLNGFAQPEPRPYPKSGRNEIQSRTIMVVN
jgi:hypothetical protein